MFSVDRVIALSRHYGCQINCSGDCAVCNPYPGRLHEALNHFDTAAGIETRGPHDKWVYAAGFVPVNTLGTRLALHEEHLAREQRLKAPSAPALKHVHLSDISGAPPPYVCHCEGPREVCTVCR